MNDDNNNNSDNSNHNSNRTIISTIDNNNNYDNDRYNLGVTCCFGGEAPPLGPSRRRLSGARTQDPDSAFFVCFSSRPPFRRTREPAGLLAQPAPVVGQDSSKGGAVETGCSGFRHIIGCFVI